MAGLQGDTVGSGASMEQALDSGDVATVKWGCLLYSTKNLGVLEQEPHWLTFGESVLILQYPSEDDGCATKVLTASAKVGYVHKTYLQRERRP